MHLSVEAGEQRAAERLAVDDLEAVAGRDAELGEVAQHLRVGVRDAHEHAGRAVSKRREASRSRSSISSCGVRDRVPVRVVRGVAELRRDQLLELLGQHVLEHLGLVVHAVPRHAQRLREVQLQQAVVAQHLERDAPAPAVSFTPL